MRRLKHLFLGLVTASLLFTSGFLAAQSTPVLDRVMDRGILRVGMSGTQPPYTFRSTSGRLAGMDVDLALLLSEAMEVELELIAMPFGQLREALNSGQVDMVISGMSITAERAREMLFVGPYNMSGRSILTNSRALAAAEAPDDINRDNLKLAALEGSTSQRFIERFVPDAQLVTVSAYDQGVQMVLDDTVDAMVADMSICMLSLLRFPDRGLATLSQPMTIEPIGIAVSSSDQMFRSLLQNYLDGFIGLGILDELRAQWFEDGNWLSILP